MPSSYYSRLRGVVKDGIRRSILGQEGGIQDSVELLLRRGKFGFCSYRFLHSLRIAALTDLQVVLRPESLFAASSDTLVVNRRRNISVIGAFSRSISVPSVSGPSFQVCGYHIDRAICNTDQESENNRKFEITLMASSARKTTLGECFRENIVSRGQHCKLSAASATVSFGSRRLHGCRNASMCLHKGEHPSDSLMYRYVTFNIMQGWSSLFPYIENGFRHLHNSSGACFSAGTAPDVTYENSAHEEQLGGSAGSSDQSIPAAKTLKLVSGSCYLPHPDKEKTGGEDAHFICTDEQAIGVADGVGGWAALGVNAGLYSRELMSNSVNAIQEEPKGSVDPARVLEKAHSSTKAKGSSTACIIALTDEGLHAINLGDSGFMVVRDGCTIFRSPVQQHDFNFTYQLESGDRGDLPSSGQIFAVPVAPGDVIIAGTDGLFDNLYNNEITAVVVHAMRAGLSPQVTAQKIAALARQRAQDKERQTPFSTAAQDAGIRYYGGKLDDITVVVSYVRSASNESQGSL